MNKTLIAVIVVVLLGVGGYGAYRVYNHFARLSSSASTQTQVATNTGSPVTSLEQLIAKGTTETCTFSNTDTNGTVYVSGGKVRTDFSSTVDNVTTKGHTIVIDNTTYLWMDGQSVGSKMSFNPSETPAPVTGTGSSTEANSNLNANATMDYKCSTWIADSSKFNLPAGVTFSDFSIPATAPQGSPASGSSSSSQCSYCASLSGDAKTQCLTALKCN